MRTLICALLLTLSLPLPGATFEEGRSAYVRGDYGAARGPLTTHAEAGNAQAQYLLGRMYAGGEGLLQDFVPAHKWLNLAASQGLSDARTLRDTISARMTAGQLAEAQSLARAWQPTPLPATASAPPPSSNRPAPVASASATASAAAPANRRELVREVQSMLAELGYDPGPADGLMGQRTRSAIRAYQLHSGLSVDGEPSSTVYGALRTDLGYADRGRTAPASPAAAPPAPVASAPPPAPAPSRQQASARPRPAADPIVRLRQIIDDGEARGAAGPRLIGDLRELLGRYDWPWRVDVVTDDFRDGDYTRNPAWQVQRGQFWVNANEGLRTQVALADTAPSGASEAPAEEGRSSNAEIGLALLGAILAQQQGGARGGTAPAAAAPGDAEIVLPARVPASYAIEAGIVSGEAGGRLDLGVYQGTRSDVGYRLVYLGGGPRTLQLLRVRGNQEAVIELHDPALNLEDGRVHEVLWTRDGAGRMSVSLDGQHLFSATDRGLSGAFDGVVLSNRGGNYALRSLRVLGER